MKSRQGQQTTDHAFWSGTKKDNEIDRITYLQILQVFFLQCFQSQLPDHVCYWV